MLSKLHKLRARHLRQSAVGWKHDRFSCPVESTITRSNSAAMNAFMSATTAIAVANNSSTPALPSVCRNCARFVGERGRRD
ncbi:hypothetical protein [Burkholderia ubonensis]|uniref:hypothetical protein n=1 Tax=Burkholderia ubonensis TaxID=101571 RepID=UPI0012FAE0AE